MGLIGCKDCGGPQQNLRGGTAQELRGGRVSRSLRHPPETVGVSAARCGFLRLGQSRQPAVTKQQDHPTQRLHPEDRDAIVQAIAERVAAIVVSAPPLLDVQGVARVLACSADTVYSLQRELGGFRLRDSAGEGGDRGNPLRFKREDVEAFIERRRRAAGPSSTPTSSTQQHATQRTPGRRRVALLDR